jgi:hypothetical protein
MTFAFVEADREYRAKLEATGDLASAFAAACAVGTVDLCGTDLTRAVLARMKSYYTAQEQIKEVLEKRYAAAAADFFVETVAFYLKVAIQIRKLTLSVTSEQVVNKHVRQFFKAQAKAKALIDALGLDQVKTILDTFGLDWPDAIAWAKGDGRLVSPVPKEIRADISAWSGDSLVAVIECKTQFGRARTTWLEDFEKREAQLRIQQPRANLFLLVMTEANWDGFDRHDCRFGKQFFALLDKDHWPTAVEPSGSKIAGLVHPVESLFRLVLG